MNRIFRFHHWIIHKLSKIFWRIIRQIPSLRVTYYTKSTHSEISLRMWFIQKVVGINRLAYWPVHHSSVISGSIRNIYCGIEASPGLSNGCYIQAIGKIYIGDYTLIAPNVGIISANHSVFNASEYLPSEVRIGAYCWIGMNSVILPGIVLGDFTIVGAGSVVTNSFPNGFCIIAGNPAKLLRVLDTSKCTRHRSRYEYNGYIPHSEFEAFRRNCLDV
jgi:acetyltransferase-like isoleucine patch superfamily enzyme